MELSTTDKQKLHDALLDAFTSDSFARMLDLYAGKRMDFYTARFKDLPDIVVDVMNGAQREGWLFGLIDAARRANPGNERLSALATVIGVAPVTAALERMVREELPFLDIAMFRERLTAIESQVCRVETPSEYGTGFLLGPDALITNHHVLVDVIEGKHAPEEVTFRFDYKILADGSTLNPGTIFRLPASEWLLHWSASMPSQSSGDSSPALDYALVRVTGSPGSQPINPGVKGQSGSGLMPPRGWIEIPDPAPTLAIDDPIFIVEHPEAEPLKLALETKSFVGLFENDTRMRHRTNTGKGSSGSPCFDDSWNLVALHRGGDLGPVAEWNEAIPFPAITTRLRESGKWPLPGIA
jgi:hypothetical protein